MNNKLFKDDSYKKGAVKTYIREKFEESLDTPDEIEKTTEPYIDVEVKDFRGSIVFHVLFSRWLQPNLLKLSYNDITDVFEAIQHMSHQLPDGLVWHEIVRIDQHAIAISYIINDNYALDAWYKENYDS